jgi:DNA-binding NarL/FixJ family response regulator
VRDAAAARDVFRHVPVDALVVDVDLPGISGPELLDRLGHDPTCLSKPFEVDVLLKELERAVAARRS